MGEQKKSEKNKSKAFRVIIGFLICAVFISAGFTGMNQLSASKKGAEKKKPSETRLEVETMPAEKQNISLVAKGYGEAYPVNVMTISPEVSGRVVEASDRLNQGEIINKGEFLFKIDSTDYEIDAEKATIKVTLQQNKISRLTVESENDQARLASVKRNTQLAKTEFLRLKTLYEKEKVGSLSSVDQAEQTFNSLLDTEKNLVKTIALYPLLIAEAQSNLEEARSDLKTARLNVQRCTLSAPFTGRIKEESIEKGKHINIGTNALVLADDTVLEIQVPLSDKDAFQILHLRKSDSPASWYSGLKNRKCVVRTVTGEVSNSVDAVIDRIVKYDSASRTLFVAVRVDQDIPTESRIPVMDGMFCVVSISGKVMEDAVKIPKTAVNSDDTIYLVIQNRLKTFPVNVVMEDGDYSYITGTLETGDRIITTKLVNPLENSLLTDLNSTGDLR